MTLTPVLRHLILLQNHGLQGVVRSVITVVGVLFEFYIRKSKGTAKNADIKENEIHATPEVIIITIVILGTLYWGFGDLIYLWAEPT